MLPGNPKQNETKSLSPTMWRVFILVIKTRFCMYKAFCQISLFFVTLDMLLIHLMFNRLSSKVPWFYWRISDFVLIFCLLQSEVWIILETYSFLWEMFVKAWFFCSVRLKLTGKIISRLSYSSILFGLSSVRTFPSQS